MLWDERLKKDILKLLITLFALLLYKLAYNHKMGLKIDAWNHKFSKQVFFSATIRKKYKQNKIGAILI